jgi:hypothetical protein
VAEPSLHDLLWAVVWTAAGGDPFNRFTKMMEAVVRRYAWVTISFYFDDATIQDWSSAKGSGQRAARCFLQMVGQPFAAEKQQNMSLKGDFLGLLHDLTEAVSAGIIRFWVRDRLQQKILDFISEARMSQSLKPGVASKLYGCASFFGQGIFGKLGRAGLQALKDRQYEGGEAITPGIKPSFAMIEALVRDQPEREHYVGVQLVDRFLVASDDALEEPRQGTGGYLVVWMPAGARQAWVVDIPNAVYDIWDDSPFKIAQLELLMVLVGLVHQADKFRGRHGVWFIDNVAALMALVRGGSDSPELDEMASMIHARLFGLRTWMYFEWIESKSNWSDGISRDGFTDAWYQQHEFRPGQATIPLCRWRLPLRAIVRVSECL